MQRTLLNTNISGKENSIESFLDHKTLRHHIVCRLFFHKLLIKIYMSW